MKLFQNLIPIVFLLLVAGCREEYLPEVQTGEQSVLVVEGYLNSGDGPTTIKLSRTVQLSDSVFSKFEEGATVVVEGKSGSQSPLYELPGSGSYTAWQLPLNTSDSFRLHINTRVGEEYVSDYVAVLKNPDIDSVSWRRTNGDVTIFVNTHNPENDTRYYRWEFEEAWEYHAAFVSLFKLEGDAVIPRSFPEDQVYTCWKKNNSSSIITASNAGLANDVVQEKPLIIIPDNNIKIDVRYSVLVRQFPLDKRGYDFYQLLKKNTESLGSIFDAQPTELISNIHIVKGAPKSVIGYISALPIKEKRLFITRSQVPGWSVNRNCFTLEVPNNSVSIRSEFGSGNYMPYDGKGQGPSIVAWYASVPECVDCRLQGGTTQQPDFW